MSAPDFSVKDVLAWARTKPADERYDFTEANSCAVAQFGWATGRGALINVADIRELPVEFAWALWKAAVSADTFGEFADNLEALCPKSNWLTIDAYMDDDERVEA